MYDGISGKIKRGSGREGTDSTESNGVQKRDDNDEQYIYIYIYIYAKLFGKQADWEKGKENDGSVCCRFESSI